MHSHVIDPLRSLLLYDFEVNLRREVFNALNPADGFINGNGTDRNRRVAENRLAYFRNIAACAEIHDRIGAEVDCGVQLLKLFSDIGGYSGVADIRIDLAAW